jgi:hypothetical protein
MCLRSSSSTSFSMKYLGPTTKSSTQVSLYFFFFQKKGEIFGAYHKVINADKLVYEKLKFEHDELHKKCDTVIIFC